MLKIPLYLLQVSLNSCIFHEKKIYIDIYIYIPDFHAENMFITYFIFMLKKIINNEEHVFIKYFFYILLCWYLTFDSWITNTHNSLYSMSFFDMKELAKANKNLHTISEYYTDAYNHRNNVLRYSKIFTKKIPCISHAEMRMTIMSIYVRRKL